MVDALDVGGGVAVPERRRERGPAAGDPRPHGPDRDVEGRGDLRVVEVGDVAEHDRDAEVLGQGRERGLEVEAVDDALGTGARAARAGRGGRGGRMPGRRGVRAAAARRARRSPRCGATTS